MDGAVERKSGNGFLVGILVFLGVVIVGLIIGLIVLNNRNEETSVQESLSEDAIQIVDASTVCGDIRYKYDTGEYTYELAINDLDEAMVGSNDDSFRISLATCYADFVSSYSEDYNLALDILNSVKDEMQEVDSGIAVKYYLTAVRICKKFGNDELASYYEQEATNLTRRTEINEG